METEIRRKLNRILYLFNVPEVFKASIMWAISIKNKNADSILKECNKRKFLSRKIVIDNMQ